MTGSEADFLTIKTRRDETHDFITGRCCRISKAAGPARIGNLKARKPVGPRGWSAPRVLRHPQRDTHRVLLHSQQAGATTHPRAQPQQGMADHPVLVCFAIAFSAISILAHSSSPPALCPPAQPSRIISSPTSPGALMPLPGTYLHRWPTPYFPPKRTPAL